MGLAAQPQVDIGQPSVEEYPKADWERLWAHHSHGLYRRVMGIVRNPEDAEDALQEGILSAFKNLPRFEGRSGLSTWLTRIVINAALMQGSSRFKGRQVLMTAMEVDTEVPVLVLARSYNRRCYEQAMQSGALDYVEGRLSNAELVAFLETFVPRRTGFPRSSAH